MAQGPSNYSRRELPLARPLLPQIPTISACARWGLLDPTIVKMERSPPYRDPFSWLPRRQSRPLALARNALPRAASFIGTLLSAGTSALTVSIGIQQTDSERAQSTLRTPIELVAELSRVPSQRVVAFELETADRATTEEPIQEWWYASAPLPFRSRERSLKYHFRP